MHLIWTGSLFAIPKRQETTLSSPLSYPTLISKVNNFVVRLSLRKGIIAEIIDENWISKIP